MRNAHIKRLLFYHHDPPLDRRDDDSFIGFTVRVDCVNRECFVSNEALVKLSEHMTLGPMETFCALERNIRGVVRRLIQSELSGTPLQLGPNTFNNANGSLSARGA